MDLSEVSRPLRVAVVLVFLEAAALLTFAVAELVNINQDRVSLGLTNAIFFTAYGVGLGYAGWALLHLRRWSRGPVLLAQLIQLGVASSFAGGDTTWVSVVLGVAAAIVVVVMVLPSTTRALYGPWSDVNNPDEADGTDDKGDEGGAGRR